MTDQTEFRITNETTGGQKGQKAERFDLIPAGPMEAVARHYGIGARKYDDDNWRKGYSWRLTLGALERHLNKIKKGEDIDVDTLPDGTVVESPHAAAIVFHALALLEFAETHPELDDRWKPEPPAPKAPTPWEAWTESVLMAIESYTIPQRFVGGIDPARASHPSYGTHIHAGVVDAASTLVAADPEPYVPAVGDTIATLEGLDDLPKGTVIAYANPQGLGIVVNRLEKVSRGRWKTTHLPQYPDRVGRVRPRSALQLRVNGGWTIESLPQPTPKYAGGDRISVRDVIKAFESQAIGVGPDSDGDIARLCDPDSTLHINHEDTVAILNALEDRGYEVTYAGDHVTPEPEVKVVPQDGVDFGTVVESLEGTRIRWDGKDGYIMRRGATMGLSSDDVQRIVAQLDRDGLRIVTKA